MPAPAPTTLSIITSALRKLGVMGVGVSTPNAEDLDLGLETFNEIAEQLNLRKRNAAFERTQAFTFTTSQVSYTIGTAANGADFVVAAGDRPPRLEYANVVNTDTTPYTFTRMAIINIEQYVLLDQPELPSQFPLVLYYQPAVPNGIIYPYPASPSQTSYQISLTWWNQLDTVALGDISTALVLPQGYRRGLATKLAVALWPSFTKLTELAELLRQDREAWADISSVNVQPPVIPSDDGIGSGPGTLDWRTRQWM